MFVRGELKSFTFQGQYQDTYDENGLSLASRLNIGGLSIRAQIERTYSQSINLAVRR